MSSSFPIKEFLKIKIILDKLSLIIKIRPFILLFTELIQFNIFNSIATLLFTKFVCHFFCLCHLPFLYIDGKFSKIFNQPNKIISNNRFISKDMYTKQPPWFSLKTQNIEKCFFIHLALMALFSNIKNRVKVEVGKS